MAYTGSDSAFYQSNPAAAPFIAEEVRAREALEAAVGRIDRTTQLSTAFRTLQDAENVREQAPTAYQQARTAYYTLLKGSGWLAEERTRLARTEVTPEISRYIATFTSARERIKEQQSTIDILNGIKDRVLSLKDDVKYSVNTFSDQLEKVKIQIAMESRAKAAQTDSTWDWVNLALNVALVAVLLYAIVVLVRRMRASPPAPAPFYVQAPTYTRPPT